MDYAILRKRLLYKSNNRGWKETDILLGNFCRDNLNKLTNAQLNLFDLLLDEPDADIFNWMTKKTIVPEKYDNDVMELLQNYKLN